MTAQPLFWPATAVVLAQTLATLLSVERSLSVWGSYERSQGWLTLLSYYLLFLLVVARLRTRSRPITWRRPWWSLPYRW